MLNVFSVDVEEYFHPSEVQRTIHQRRWSSLPSRVERSTQQVLDLLAAHQVKATFFLLGWVAHKNPKLIRTIAGHGHEIGCHSFAHQLVYDFKPGEFRSDTIEAIRAIEDACGISPKAYRAPSLSITAQSWWALEVLVECGFTHDSSVCPVIHDRYGIPGFARFAQFINTPSGTILEVPTATVRLSPSRVAPVGGGGYLRLLPYRYTAAGIRRINEIDQKPACIYIHPWELDLDQPRIASGFVSRLRTYAGLRAMESKVRRLLTDFRFSTLSAVHPFPMKKALSQKAVAS